MLKRVGLQLGFRTDPKEDRVTDEQVRGVTWRVDKLTSRLVNKLCVKEDRVTDGQVRGVTER